MPVSTPTTLTIDGDLWRSFQYHSRTFSFAARLLPHTIQMPIATLYVFCRKVDDIADRRFFEVGPAQARMELDTLRDNLEATLQGHPPDQFFWRRLHTVHQQFGLSMAPLHELLDGAAWDLDQRPVRTQDDLIVYSNLVGGSVGAMMLPFLLHDRHQLAEAEPPARALGIGMQITNIIRDVGEDYRMGRIYLPATWMAAYDLHPNDLDSDAPPPSYPSLMEEAMDLAETFYDQGLAGLGLLPQRVRIGIRSAARSYREIMNVVRAQRYNNLSQRAVVPFRRKCALVLHDGYARRKTRLRQPSPVFSA